MAGIVAVRRQRVVKSKGYTTRHTKAENADVMRSLALGNLKLAADLPDADTTELVENANGLLELVGAMLCDLPRAGWFPRRPKQWHA